MNNETTSVSTCSGELKAKTPLWRRAEVLAAGVAVLCFANTLPNDYCYDDNRVVQHNPKVNAPRQWRAIWTTDYWYETKESTPHRDLLYRPISVSSYRLVRMTGGEKPFAQHLVNLVLHALVVVLVVQVCRRIHASECTALLAGLLFAVLPIHTEAVAPVAGRADLLATLGVLLALLVHGSALGNAHPFKRLGLWSLAGAAAFVAMGSKESGIAVIPLLVLFDAFWHQKNRCSGRSDRWWVWPTLWRLLYLLAPVVAYTSLRLYALGGQLIQAPALTKTVNVLVDSPLWQRVLGVFQLWGMYWVKTIWPDVLSIKYSVNAIRLATGPIDGHVLVGILVAALLVVASVICFKKGIKSVTILAVAILVCYLPTANAFVLIRVFFAERIWYLPSVWVVILIALAAGRLVRRPAWCVLMVAVVLAMAVRCWTRNAEWRDNGTLFAAAYRDQPNGVGPLHLYGQWLVNQAQCARGITLLERAVEIDLGFTDAHRTLGEAYQASGNLPAALRHLQTADMQAPGDPTTVDRLAQVSRELTEGDEQLTSLRRQVADSPEDVDAEIALIRRLRDLGLLGEALTRHQRRQDAFATSPTWQAEFAVTLVYLNRIDQAIDRYRGSLALDPNEPQPAVELAMLLIERRERGDLDEAKRWADHAFGLAPNDPSVLACLAELAALHGDLSTAIELYEQAIHLLPPESPQRRTFEQRVQTLGG